MCFVSGFCNLAFPPSLFSFVAVWSPKAPDGRNKRNFVFWGSRGGGATRVPVDGRRRPNTTDALQSERRFAAQAHIIKEEINATHPCNFRRGAGVVFVCFEVRLLCCVSSCLRIFVPRLPSYASWDEESCVYFFHRGLPFSELVFSLGVLVCKFACLLALCRKPS